MRASTLFALTAAILIGLGVAVWAKMSGYFNKPVEAATLKRVEPQILVAAKNLFANDVIEASGVRLRPMYPHEVSAFTGDKKDLLLPPMPTAAALRVAAKNIEADTPITRDLLKDLGKPEPLNERLLPDMRAINLVLPKDRSAGGLIQVGEWVDVFVTSNISGDGINETRTTVIAPKVRVIAKRDTLYTVFAPLPKDKPVEYTIEVNSYRAAMIEFARNKGTLSMSPLPANEQKKLEAQRKERMVKAVQGEPIIDLVAATQEEKDEVQAAQAVDKGDVVITDEDYAKLFNLKTIKESDPPPPATVTIERYVGTRRAGEEVFTLDGKRYVPGATPGTKTGYGGGFNGVYPPRPYSPAVELATGFAIPNRNYGGPGWYGGFSFGGGGMGKSGPSYRFAPTGCATCGERRAALGIGR